MPTNNDSFKPQPHDPRWVKCSERQPADEDYPLWVDACGWVVFWSEDPSPTALFPCDGRWLSDKEARSPIPCDAHEPVFPAYVFCPGNKCWGWIGKRDLTDVHENEWVSRVTHWFPLEEGKRACFGDRQPRLPRFPEGNPPAGYRWLGEGETVREGDAYLRMGCIHLVVRLVGYKVGHFDCDYADLPYIRPLDKPAAPPPVECRGSSDDLPPPAGLAALEDSLDELHDKSDTVTGQIESVVERLAAVERKLDRLLSHLGAHKPEV